MYGNTPSRYIEHKHAKPLSVSQLIIQAINHLPFTSPPLPKKEKRNNNVTNPLLPLHLHLNIPLHPLLHNPLRMRLSRPIPPALPHHLPRAHPRLLQLHRRRVSLPTRAIPIPRFSIRCRNSTASARNLWGRDVVAKTEFWGNFGGLGVYLIEKLPGVTYLEWLMKGGLGRSLELDGERFERQRGLVGDFARYVNGCLCGWLNLPQG